METRTSVLLGATGLVGSSLLRVLGREPTYSRVTLLVRRPSGLSGDRVHEAVVDFDIPDTYRSHLSADDIFCCLGTTIKKAGSQAAFRKVDCEVPVAVARDAFAAGARRFLIVTAVGANAKSSVFYNRVKGETEDALAALPFPEGVHVFHPSVLLGNRAESRPGEKVAAAFLSATRPLFAGALARYRAIDAADVARAMHNAVKAEVSEAGVHVYEGRQLFELARRAQI